ncbi:MAG: hypothetical protein A2Y10_18665 [Planctomycetes bacterium GWF2_41_51]|nr:MAG: hypothetical protein A2Y10_18665 [Planctomycetes bacterium GWF2_41_51]HBG27129.1 hypothetical protein [Phycisphaerales bacterium]
MRMRSISMLVVVACLAASLQAYSMEDPIWTDGWRTLNNPQMYDIMSMAGDQIKIWPWDSTAYLAAPGAQKSIEPGWWKMRSQNDYASGRPAADVSKYGIEWIDPSWSGKPADKAVVASYITPGVVMGQESQGYQIYHPKWPWEKTFFRSDARISVVNGAGAKLFVQAYGYINTGATQPWNDSSVLTPNGYVLIDLDDFTDYTWQNLQFTLPKSTFDDVIEPWEDNKYKSWFEIGIIGGSADTKVYIDEFWMVSDQNPRATGYTYEFTPGMVPEPTTMSLLVLGAFGLIRRRK